MFRAILMSLIPQCDIHRWLFLLTKMVAGINTYQVLNNLITAKSVKHEYFFKELLAMELRK